MGSAALTQHLGMWRRITSTKLARTFLASNAPTRQERKLNLQRKRRATLAWQTAEWGMLTMQTSFPMPKDRFAYKERGEWRIVLKMFVLLYNMQARMVGINQIQHTYKRKHPSCVLVLCGCVWCVLLCVKSVHVLFSGENYCTIGTSIVHMLRFDGIGRKRIFLTNESICSLVWNLTSLAYKLRKSSVHVLLFNLVSGL